MTYMAAMHLGIPTTLSIRNRTPAMQRESEHLTLALLFPWSHPQIGWILRLASRVPVLVYFRGCRQLLASFVLQLKIEVRHEVRCDEVLL
jgi:hypothetical protein